MRYATQGQRCQVFERLARAPLVEPASPRSSAKGRENLKVNELRSDKLLATQTAPDPIPIGTIVG